MGTEATGTVEQEIRDARDLRAARLNRGLSQRAIAGEIGIPVGVWKRAEAGLGVRPRHALKIADYFGLAVTDLWDPEERS